MSASVRNGVASCCDSLLFDALEPFSVYLQSQISTAAHRGGFALLIVAIPLLVFW